MKKRIVFQMGALIVLGSMAWAQGAPKAELGMDYSFARYAPSAAYTNGHSLNGGGGAFTYNFSRNLGIRMDLQGYNSNTSNFVIPPTTNFPGGGTAAISGNLFTYLFGPVYKVRAPKVQPYFDVLLGGAHSNVYGNAYKSICQPVAGACRVGGAPSGNAFALSAGGGLDIPINGRVQIRAGEFDYLYTDFTNQFTNSGQNNFRFLTGLNINLGTPSSSPAKH